MTEYQGQFPHKVVHGCTNVALIAQFPYKVVHGCTKVIHIHHNVILTATISLQGCTCLPQCTLDCHNLTTRLYMVVHVCHNVALIATIFLQGYHKVVHACNKADATLQGCNVHVTTLSFLYGLSPLKAQRLNTKSGSTQFTRCKESSILMSVLPINFVSHSCSIQAVMFTI